jgi:hypothetical protein
VTESSGFTIAEHRECWVLTAVLRSARPPASNYLRSLGTNTVLGNSTYGPLVLLPDVGPKTEA